MRQIRYLIFILLVVASVMLTSAGDLPPFSPASSETQEDLALAFSRRLQRDSETHALVFDLFTTSSGMRCWKASAMRRPLICSPQSWIQLSLAWTERRQCCG